MRSFGLWYKMSDETESTNKNEDRNNKTEEVETDFDIHINFWSESIKNDNKVPNLDIGMKIKNFKAIDEVIFHCPFIIKEDEIKDLVCKLEDKKNADLVFNTDGKIETKESYYLYSFKKDTKEKDTKEEKLLLFCLKQNMGEMYTLEEREKKTDIKFNFSKFNTYINKHDFDNINDMYIRFRISSNDLENNIYFDSELSNKSFDSAFSGTRIFDFKINEKRNLGSETITDIDMKNYVFPKIGTIHLLVMEPASYEVQSFTDVPMTCRELEGKLWNEYFGSSIDSSKSRILAYHWKFENEYSYSCLVKVKYSKTNLLILIAYIFMVLALGIFSSTIVAFIQSSCINYFPYITLSVGVAFGALGLFLGRKK